MARSDRALRPNPMLSTFSCLPSSSSLYEMSGSKLDARNSYKSGKLSLSLPLLLFAIIVNMAATIHSKVTHVVTGLHPLHFHLSQKHTIWLKIGTVYQLLCGLLRGLKLCQYVERVLFVPRDISVLHKKICDFTWPLKGLVHFQVL